MKKKIEIAINLTPPIVKSGERFTEIMADAGTYPLLSVHEFGGVRYQVTAILQHTDGVAVEFVRVA